MSDINIEKVTPEGDGNLIIRTGAAPDPINPTGQKPVDINGRLDAPANYYTARIDTDQFDQSDCVVEVDYESRRIRLLIHQDIDHKKVVVAGSLELDHRLARFCINNPNKTFNRDTLARLFKFNRSSFTLREEGMTFVKKLKDFQLKYEQTFDAQDDQRGNIRMKVERAITESDIPSTISLNLPIFKGAHSQEIVVDVLFNVDSSGDVSFYLESPEVAEAIDGESMMLIDEQLQTFEGVAIIRK